MDFKQISEMLAKILTVVGDISISEAKKWADAKVNAENLVEETADTPAA